MSQNLKNIIIIIACLSNQCFAQVSDYMSFFNEKEAIHENFNRGRITSHEAFKQYKKLQIKAKSINYECYVDTFLETATTLYIANKKQLAIEEYKLGIKASEALKGFAKDTIQFKLYADLGSNYNKKHELDSAKTCFEMCHKILTNNPAIASKLTMYNMAYLINYGFFYQQMNDYQTSNYYYLSAIESTENPSLNIIKGFAFEGLAQNYQETQQYDEAIKNHKQGILFTKRGEYKTEKYLKISRLELLLNRNLSAFSNIKSAERALSQSEFLKAGAIFPTIEMQIALAYGEYYNKQKNISLAKTFYQKTLAINQKYFETEKGIFVAEALIALGKIKKDESYFDRAALAVKSNPNPDDFISIISPKWLMESQLSKAKLQSISLNPNADATYLDVIKTAAKVRKSFNFSESKVFYTEKIYPVYEEALQHLSIKKTASKEVFASIIEYSKAATLSDVLIDNSIKPKNIDAQKIAQEKQLLAERNKLQIKIQESKTKNERIDSEKKLNDINLKINYLYQEFESKNPAYFQLKLKTDIAKTAEIQANLDTKTAVISYLLGSKKIYVSIITKESLNIAFIPIDSSFNKNLNYFLKQLYTKPALGNYKSSEMAQWLFGKLIKPIEHHFLSKKRLVILRDAELNFLPFEILEKQKNHYLLHDFAVSYAYSTSIWQLAKQQAKSNIFSLISIAPYTNKAALPFMFRDAVLKPLPASNKEVTQIGGTIYKNNSATKNSFLENYRNHGIVHFATHAQIDDFDPSKSFLAFYPDSTDYKLFTNEIYNLSLEKTRLVVLSACEAGRGKLNRGEGVMSLARAFAYAGCPSVVTTLWNAHDESTAYLSERLHHYIKAGEPLDFALQKAKLDYFDSEIGQELDHPYYWANFILIGDYAPISEGHISLIWILAGIFTVFLLIFLSKRI